MESWIAKREKMSCSARTRKVLQIRNPLTFNDQTFFQMYDVMQYDTFGTGYQYDEDKQDEELDDPWSTVGQNKLIQKFIQC